jgi:hypothetical protein
MDTVGICLNWCITIGLVAIAWVLPRKLGLIGMLGHHMLTLYGYFLMGVIALVFGVWDQYEDGLVIIGLAIQAFLFNCLLLPVSMTAMIRFGRENEPPVQSSLPAVRSQSPSDDVLS